jgi:hypothetical protein
MKKKWFLYTAIALSFFLPGISQAQIAQRPRVPPEVRKNIEEKGVSRVTVRLNVSVRTEKLSPSEEARQQSDILATQNALLSQLKGTKHKVIKQYKSGPFIDLEVDQAGLAILAKSTLVKTMTNEANLRYKRMLYQSVPMIGGAAAFLAGYDGTGQTIVVIGTGIDADHPMLDGKIVAEACYQSEFTCPNGQHSQFGTGAATTCVELDDCEHETHVAGIAAGLQVTDPETNRTFSGVAKGAQIAAIRISSHDGEGGPGDFYDALDYTYAVFANEFTIASVNFSWGTSYYPDQALCDAENDLIKFQIDRLRAAGIATIIASGNEQHADGISAPACISSAVSVGATTKNDAIWNEAAPSTEGSNTAAYLSLVAPGAAIFGPERGDQYCCDSGGGTSAAAPHVAGAWAIMKQKYPNATVAQVLAALQLTALPIKDTRDSDPTKQYVQCRIRIDKALENFPENNFIKFNAPNGDGLGNYFGINKCQIVGNVGDAYWPYDIHGFVLNGIGGDFIKFDVPNSIQPQASGINNTGHITGYTFFSEQNSQPERGYVRYPDGTFDVPINAPEASASATWAINDAGTAVGWWAPPQVPGQWTPNHGLFKPLGGAVQTIDRPDAWMTQFYGINNLGQMVGFYSLSDGLQRSFLRLANGTFQDLSCSGAAENSTAPFGINDAGYIVGSYWDGGDSSPAFVRSTDGTCNTFSVPNSYYTWPTAINNFGQVVGAYWDDSGGYGFVFNSVSE